MSSEFSGRCEDLFSTNVHSTKPTGGDCDLWLCVMLAWMEWYATKPLNWRCLTVHIRPSISSLQLLTQPTWLFVYVCGHQAWRPSKGLPRVEQGYIVSAYLIQTWGILCQWFIVKTWLELALILCDDVKNVCLFRIVWKSRLFWDYPFWKNVDCSDTENMALFHCGQPWWRKKNSRHFRKSPKELFDVLLGGLGSALPGFVLMD